MEKEFVPHRQSIDIRDLGFDEKCFGWYAHNGVYTGYSIKNSTMDELNMIKNSCSAPTYSQAFRWFREKYQIDSWVYPNLNDLYSVSIVRRGVGLGKVSEYQTYEEAELECLVKLIEIVKSNEK